MGRCEQNQFVYLQIRKVRYYVWGNHTLRISLIGVTFKPASVKNQSFMVKVKDRRTNHAQQWFFTGRPYTGTLYPQMSARSPTIFGCSNANMSVHYTFWLFVFRGSSNKKKPCKKTWSPSQKIMNNVHKSWFIQSLISAKTLLQ